MKTNVIRKNHDEKLIYMEILLHIWRTFLDTNGYALKSFQNCHCETPLDFWRIPLTMLLIKCQHCLGLNRMSSFQLVNYLSTQECLLCSCFAVLIHHLAQAFQTLLRTGAPILLQQKASSSTRCKTSSSMATTLPLVYTPFDFFLPVFQDTFQLYPTDSLGLFWQLHSRACENRQRGSCEVACVVFSRVLFIAPLLAAVRSHLSGCISFFILGELVFAPRYNISGGIGRRNG